MTSKTRAQSVSKGMADNVECSVCRVFIRSAYRILQLWKRKERNIIGWKEKESYNVALMTSLADCIGSFGARTTILQ